MSSATRMEVPALSVPMALSLSDWMLMSPHFRIAMLLALTLTACQTAPDAREGPKLSTTTIRPTISTTTTTTPVAAPPETTTTTIARVVVQTPPHNHPPVPVLGGVGSRVPEDIAALVRKHFDEFGPEVSEWFLGIVWRESNGRPDAWNRASGCYGLAQIALPLHQRRFLAHGWDWQTSWMDPDKNLTVAADIYRSSGRGPWSL